MVQDSNIIRTQVVSMMPARRVLDSDSKTCKTIRHSSSLRSHTSKIIFNSGWQSWARTIDSGWLNKQWREESTSHHASSTTFWVKVPATKAALLKWCQRPTSITSSLTRVLISKWATSKARSIWATCQITRWFWLRAAVVMKRSRPPTSTITSSPKYSRSTNGSE